LRALEDSLMSKFSDSFSDDLDTYQCHLLYNNVNDFLQRTTFSGTQLTLGDNMYTAFKASQRCKGLILSLKLMGEKQNWNE